jgi:hypothetical protein
MKIKATGSYRCTNSAKVWRNTVPYCGVHDPVRRSAAQHARQRKVKARTAGRVDGVIRAMAASAACKGIPTEALEDGRAAALLAPLREKE